jgi:glycine/D-amino acid oxidase-like deaminating enzyme
MNVDVLIFGGGIAGLWLLDDLRRAGYGCVLVETGALGGLQTAASQGIIHGGLKYMFDGNVTPSASCIADMPGLWRASLAGQAEPLLAKARVLSPCCHIWGAGSLISPLLLLGSRIALRTKPVAAAPEDVPGLLRRSGQVLRVDEQVIDCGSVTGELVRRNEGRFLHGDAQAAPVFAWKEGAVAAATVAAGGVKHTFEPRTVVFCAGDGNAALRRQAGLADSMMQRRPLHTVMVRGALPPFFGHCIGHPKPRLTITSITDGAGRMVWQIGGKLAEDGVAMAPPQLLDLARKELRQTLPRLDLDGLEWAAYRIDRAEAATNTGQKPDDVHLVREGNVVTAWPTKLALAPRLAARIRELLAPPGRAAQTLQGPAPPLARGPWETATWHSA